MMNIKISTNMSGKMDGIHCISTNNINNPTCQSRRNIKGSVCEKCYAYNTARRYPSLKNNLDHNSEVLSELINDKDLPIINDLYFRLEAFGELINEYHAMNYINIAYKNPAVKFALYTKNIGILERAISIIGKPDNLTVVQSSLMINIPDATVSPVADHLFTVYSKPYVSMNDIQINCGAKQCITCLKCYNKHTDMIINEQLK